MILNIFHCSDFPHNFPCVRWTASTRSWTASEPRSSTLGQGAGLGDQGDRGGWWPVSRAGWSPSTSRVRNWRTVILYYTLVVMTCNEVNEWRKNVTFLHLHHKWIMYKILFNKILLLIERELSSFSFKILLQLDLRISLKKEWWGKLTNIVKPSVPSQSS